MVMRLIHHLSPSQHSTARLTQHGLSKADSVRRQEYLRSTHSSFDSTSCDRSCKEDYFNVSTGQWAPAMTR